MMFLYMVDVPICYFVFSLRQRNKHFTLFLRPFFMKMRPQASVLLTKVLHETLHLLNPCHHEKMISSIPTPSNVLLLQRSSSCAPFRTIVVNMPLRQKIDNVAEKKLASTWIMLAELKLNMNIQNFDRLLDNLTCNTFNFRQLVCFQVYVLVKKNLSLHSVR